MSSFYHIDIAIALLVRSSGVGLILSILLTLFRVPAMSMNREEWHSRKSEKEEPQGAIRFGPTTPLPGLE